MIDLVQGVLEEFAERAYHGDNVYQLIENRTSLYGKPATTEGLTLHGEDWTDAKLRSQGHHLAYMRRRTPEYLAKCREWAKVVRARTPAVKRRASADPKRRSREAAYYAAHKEEKKAAFRAYYEAHKEECRAKARARYHKRRANRSA